MNGVARGAGTLVYRGMAMLLLSLALAACGKNDGERGSAPGEEAGVAKIQGQVIYRERMMVPPGAEVEVQLQDISRADAMATVMASVLSRAEGGPPYPFSIEYDPARIDPRMRYALRATISVGDQLLFTTTDYIDPFSGNPVEVLVRRVAEPVSRDGPSLEGTLWLLQTLAGDAAPVGADGKPVSFQLMADEGRVGGFSGCNRYMGSYSLEGAPEHGSPLTIGPLAGTMMACADGGELERRYLEILAAVTGFTLQGETLSLLSGGDTVATFLPE